jgi:hypothetical protein
LQHFSELGGVGGVELDVGHRGSLSFRARARARGLGAGVGGIGFVAVDFAGGGAGHHGGGLASMITRKSLFSQITVAVLPAWIIPAWIFCRAT